MSSIKLLLWIVLCTVVLTNVKFVNSSLLYQIYPAKFEYYEYEGDVVKPVSDLSPPKAPGQKIYVIIHGFDITLQGAKKARKIKDEIFKHKSGEVHGVVIVDWGTASRFYKTRTKTIVNQIGKELHRLNENHVLEYENTVLVGMSLGAHVAGQVGKATKKKGHTISRIDGLDPSGFMFGTDKPDETLMKGDASYVWILHANTQKFGINESIGDLDLYPNGGAMQPQCENEWLENSCSHGTVWDYYKDHLAGKNIVDPEDNTHGLNQTDRILEPTKIRATATATILILDISPSMYPSYEYPTLNRMADLIIASRRLILSFPLEHYLGIVQFGGSAEVTAAMTFVSDNNVRESLLSGLPTSGQKIWGTSIGAGLQSAVDLVKPILQNGLITGCPKFIIISDGDENTSPYIADVQSEVSELCARVDAIAIGTASKDLEDLASLTKGSVHSVRDNGPGVSDSLLQSLESSVDSQLSKRDRPIRLPPKETHLGETTHFLIDQDIGKDTRILVSSSSLFHKMKATLISPNEQTYENPLQTIDGKGLTFYIAEATSGDWMLKLEAKTTQRKRRNIKKFRATTFVTTFPRNNDSIPVVLKSALNNNTLTDRNPVTITAYVSKGNDPVCRATVSATLTSPMGQTINLTLFDNGAGTDSLKDDGIYSRSVSSLSEEGRWQISVTALSNLATCKRPREELDNFYMSAGILNKEISECTNVAQFERQTELGSLKSVGTYSNLPPNPINDFTVLSVDLISEEITLRWTASGNEGEIGTAASLNLTAIILTNFNDTDMVSLSSLPKLTIEPKHIVRGNLTPLSFGETQTVTVKIHSEEELNMDDGTNVEAAIKTPRVYGFLVQSVSVNGELSKESNIAIASFQEEMASSNENGSLVVSALLILGGLVVNAATIQFLS